MTKDSAMTIHLYLVDMFRRTLFVDKFGRKYSAIYATTKEFEPKKKVYAMVMNYKADDYIDYCRNALKNQVTKIYEHTEAGENLAEIANHALEKIPKNSWVFYVNPDEILYELPDNYLSNLVDFMEEEKIFCADVRFKDFIYNYGTLFAHFDWGEGPGKYWTARRLFKWTGAEKFRNPVHFNITNTTERIPNNEHTGEWGGEVAKLPQVQLFHYGKLRGIENQRHKKDRLIDGHEFAMGRIATIPYYGPHPKVMNLG